MTADEAAGGSPAIARPWKTISARMICWFCFGVICGLFPLFFEGLREAGASGGLHLTGVLGKGELLIVSAVVSARALGEMFRVGFPSHEDIARILVGFGCLISCVANSVAYMQVPTFHVPFIVDLSLYGFGFALIASSGAIWLVAQQ